MKGASWTRTNADGSKETSEWWREAWLYKGQWQYGFLHELTLERVADPVATRDPRLDKVAAALGVVVAGLENAVSAIKSAIAMLKEK
jgi:hypothetical protein